MMIIAGKFVSILSPLTCTRVPNMKCSIDYKEQESVYKKQMRTHHWQTKPEAEESIDQQSP